LFLNFKGNYEDYINDICWVSNTYYVSLDQKLPEVEEIRRSFELKYYQWVPFILLTQAFFFYIPHIIWRALSRRSGIDVRDIVEAASSYKSVDKYENRQKYMSYMLTSVDQYVDDPRRRRDSRTTILLKRVISGVCFISGKYLGNYLMILYLFIKMLFIMNCFIQMFILNHLLGHDFHTFGFDLINKILSGQGWETNSRIFPKISMCDFRIREVGNPKVSHRYTVQCVLPINLFNQQIFTFIWFWYAIILLVNIYSLFVWLYRFIPSKCLAYVSRRVKVMRIRQSYFSNKKRNPLFIPNSDDVVMHQIEKDLVKNFVHDYLESDGLFILRVLSSNTSDFVCTELIQELYKYYRKHRKFNRMSDDEDMDFNTDAEYIESNLKEEYPGQDKQEDEQNYNQQQQQQSQTKVKKVVKKKSKDQHYEKEK
jgi:innexin